MTKKVSPDKMQKVLAKYGLEDLNDERDYMAVQQIARELLGSGLMDAGVRLGMFAKATDQLQITYQRAIMEQNWIIIRQLDRIARGLGR